jgi:hypothetical protein
LLRSRKKDSTLYTCRCVSFLTSCLCLFLVPPCLAAMKTLPSVLIRGQPSIVPGMCHAAKLRGGLKIVNSQQSAAVALGHLTGSTDPVYLLCSATWQIDARVIRIDLTWHSSDNTSTCRINLPLVVKLLLLLLLLNIRDRMEIETGFMIDIFVI